MRTITVTGYRRPQLFRSLLVSLLANDLAGWRVVVRVEPSPAAADFVAIARELLPAAGHVVTVNPERLGVRANPFALLQDVFRDGASLNIYLEEDMAVSPDLTALAEWFAVNHQPEWICLSLLGGGCGGRGNISYPDHPDLLFLARSFNSLGFVLTREAWQRHFLPNWMADPPGSREVTGWDWAMHFHLVRNRHLRTVQPALARANHTGRDEGEHCSAEFHDLAFADLPIAALPPGTTYRLTELEELPAPVRLHAMLWDQVVTLWTFFLEKNLTIDGLFERMQTQGAEAGRLRREIKESAAREAALQSELDRMRARLAARGEQGASVGGGSELA